MTNAILTGLMLGGMYALIAMGLTLQYGVAPAGNEGARAAIVPKPAWVAP